MTKKLSIIIPVYEQIDLCRKLLESIRQQTFKDFEILIVDDQSPKADYQKLISEFSDLSIFYLHNEKNLGAMKNMEKALTLPLSSVYRIVFHEDDLMHPQLLEKEISLLDKDSLLAFVSTSMFFFDRDTEIKELSKKTFDTPSVHLYNEQKEMVVDLCMGASLCFGSVMYRNSALLPNTHFDLERFGTLSDRPLLLNLMTPSTPRSAFINEKLVFYRNHGATDTRSQNLRAQQIITFYTYYRSFFPADITGREKKIFYKESTNNLLDSYTRIHPDMTMPFDQFLGQISKENLFSFWYLNLVGIKALFTILRKRS